MAEDGANPNDIRAGGAFVEVGADTQKAKKELTDFSAMLKALKTQAGDDSNFGGLFKILTGTGAVAGIALATRTLSAMAEKAEELTNEFRSGKKSAGEVAEELLRSVPILGDIWSAGQSIREMLTGEKSENEAIRKTAEATNAFLDARAAMIARSTAAAKQHLEVVRELQEETAILNLPPDARPAAQRALDARRRDRGVDTDYEAKIKTAEEAYATDKKSIEELHKANPIVVPDPQYSQNPRVNPGIINQKAIDEANDQLDARAAQLKKLKDASDDEIKALKQQRDDEKAKRETLANAKRLDEFRVADEEEERRQSEMRGEDVEEFAKNAKERADAIKKEQEETDKARRDATKAADEAAAKEAEERANAAAKITDDVLTPLEKYEKKMKEIRDLQAGGELLPDVAKRAEDAAKKAMDDTMKKDVKAAPDFAARGTFNARNIQSLLTSPSIDKIAENTKKTERNTKKIAMKKGWTFS